MKKVNPFIYGRSLRPDEFFDRRFELNSLWDRMLSNQSSAVTGEPMIGKTSLLLKLSDINSFKQAKGLNNLVAAKFKFVLLDFMTIEGWLNPEGFWHGIFRKLKRNTRGDIKFQKILEKFEKTFNNFEDRRDFFGKIGSRGYRVILMLDELERLVKHENFKTPDFYGQLRHLANLTDGLVVIAASQMSVSELNSEGRAILDVGSPFFNNLMEFKLKGFDGPTIEEFLKSRVPEWGDNERKFVISMAGHHPALIQGVGRLLWGEIQKSDNFEKAQLGVFERLNVTFSDFFDTVWERFSDSGKLAAFIVGIGDILELPWGKYADELKVLKNINFKEIMAQKNLQGGLKELSELGLIVPRRDNEVDFDVASMAFLFWLKDKMGEEDFLPVVWGAKVGVKEPFLKELGEIADKSNDFLNRIVSFWELATKILKVVGSSFV